MQRKHLLTEEAGSTGYADRRAEPRWETRGEVRLEPDEDTCGGVVVAELLDLSRSGFRAHYAIPSLVSGQRVAFHRQDASGTAIVVWSRVLGRDVESGFLVLALHTNDFPTPS